MIRPALIAAALCIAAPAWAQINVRLDLERERYLLYEPLTATVEVHNYSASPIQLADQESTPWLQFEITRSTGERIGIVGPGFLAGAMTLPARQSGAKSVNLVAYYQIREPGRYRVRAMVKGGGLGGSFASREYTFHVVSGRQMLSKSAGFKDEAGKEGLRDYSLIEVLLGRHVWLYARVEEPNGGNIYGVLPLGEWVTFSRPAADTDKDGNFHVLHQTHPRQFYHSIITPKGTVSKRETFSNYNSVPDLKRQPDGSVKVVGGESTSRHPSQPAPSPAP